MNALSWGYSEEEFGFMTYRKWSLLYKAYKQKFDMELMMRFYGSTYQQLEPQHQNSFDVIPM